MDLIKTGTVLQSFLDLKVKHICVLHDHLAELTKPFQFALYIERT